MSGFSLISNKFLLSSSILLIPGFLEVGTTVTGQSQRHHFSLTTRIVLCLLQFHHHILEGLFIVILLLPNNRTDCCLHGAQSSRRKSYTNKVIINSDNKQNNSVYKVQWNCSPRDNSLFPPLQTGGWGKVTMRREFYFGSWHEYNLTRGQGEGNRGRSDNSKTEKSRKAFFFKLMFTKDLLFKHL